MTTRKLLTALAALVTAASCTGSGPGGNDAIGPKTNAGFTGKPIACRDEACSSYGSTVCTDCTGGGISLSCVAGKCQIACAPGPCPAGLACVPSGSSSYSARVCAIDCASGAPCPSGQSCADPGNGFKTCTSSPTPGSPAGPSAACKKSPSATSWDVAADFSGDANPCAPWTYGYTRGLGTSPLTVYTSTRTANPVFWTDPGNETSSTPSAGQNASASTLYGIAPGQFSLHGGPNGEYSIARWTAPRAGTFAVRVQFFMGDVADTDGAVLRSSNVLFRQDTDPQPTYASKLTLAEGETLDVAVGKIDRFESGSTPVTFTVQQQ